MEKYSLKMRVMHWLLALMFIGIIPFGMWMKGLPDSYPGKFDFYALHKSAGLLALVFVAARLVIRYNSRIPRLPKKISKFDSNLSSLTILLLYVCMFLMPISGYLMSTFGGYEVKFFGMKVPALFAPNKSLGRIAHEAHELVAYSIIALVALHIAGTIKHVMFEKVNLFKRIW